MVAAVPSAANAEASSPASKKRRTDGESTGLTLLCCLTSNLHNHHHPCSCPHFFLVPSFFYSFSSVHPRRAVPGLPAHRVAAGPLELPQGAAAGAQELCGRRRGRLQVPGRAPPRGKERGGWGTGQGYAPGCGYWSGAYMLLLHRIFLVCSTSWSSLTDKCSLSLSLSLCVLARLSLSLSLGWFCRGLSTCFQLARVRRSVAGSARLQGRQLLPR